MENDFSLLRYFCQISIFSYLELSKLFSEKITLFLSRIHNRIYTGNIDYFRKNIRDKIISKSDCELYGFPDYLPFVMNPDLDTTSSFHFHCEDYLKKCGKKWKYILQYINLFIIILIPTLIQIYISQYSTIITAIFALIIGFLNLATDAEYVENLKNRKDYLLPRSYPLGEDRVILQTRTTYEKILEWLRYFVSPSKEDKWTNPDIFCTLTRKLYMDNNRFRQGLSY